MSSFLSSFYYLFPSSSESHSPLVRRIVKSRSKEYFHATKGVSYTTLREEFRKYVKPFVDDIASYGTHSIKSGAASNPACKSISADLLAWTCTPAGNVPLQRTDTSVKHTVSDRLKAIALLFQISFVYDGLFN